LLYRWRCHWFERNLALQRQLFPPQPLKVAPLFILGFWRSGTTYLHELIASGSHVKAPATWQCMNPSSFRLRAPPARRLYVQRPMDSAQIDTLSPQEDEFALLALGVPSVYRGFLDPRRLADLARWLDPRSWTANEPMGWLQTWQRFLEDVAAGDGTRLVLKSPGHTFRCRALGEAYPESKYMWLVRDPVDTYFSNQKMWTAMFERYGLWKWEPEMLDEFLSIGLEMAAECLAYSVEALSSEQIVVVDFEKLTRLPVDTVEWACCRLGLEKPDRQRCTQIATSGSARRADTYGGYRLPDRIVAAARKARQLQQIALERRGI